MSPTYDFETHIRPLFEAEEHYIEHMLPLGIDLSNCADVVEHSHHILERLSLPAGAAGAMPPDGRWPQADIDKFETWMSELVEVVNLASVINFNDIPEGETIARAAVFRVYACRDVTLKVKSGSGPGAPYSILTPGGSVTTVHDPSSPFVEARIWFLFTGTAAGTVAPVGNVIIECEETEIEYPFTLHANSIARPIVAVAMALDKSNSMNFESGLASPHETRIEVLRFSAPPFVDVIQENNAMGIVAFDHDPHDVFPMTVMGPVDPFDVSRANAKAAILGHTPNPLGNTAIGDGVEKANQLLYASTAIYDPTDYTVKATIVLTDGHNTAPQDISAVSDLIAPNNHIFAIGLGTVEEIQPSALLALCNGHEGYLLMTGSLDEDDLFRLAKYYLQILAGVTNENIVVDPEGSVLPGQEHRIPFGLNETDISSDVILLTLAPDIFKFSLETPAGDVIDSSIASASPVMSYVSSSNVSYYRMRLPIPVGGSEAREGTWHAVLTVDDNAYRKYLPTVYDYPRLHQSTQAHGVRYSLSVHSRSNLRLRAHLGQNSLEPGATLTLRSVVTEYGIPVEARATVRADLERPDKTTTTLRLEEVEPGVFQTSVVASLSGVYHFRVRATGKTLRRQSFTREQVLTGAVWHGGNQPLPRSREPSVGEERLRHLLCCLFESKALDRFLSKHDIDREMVHRCLKAYCYPETGGPPSDIIKIEGIDPVLASQLMAVDIRTLSDLADPEKIENAGKIEGISSEQLQIFHEEAKLAVRHPELTPNELEVAVQAFELKVPLDAQRLTELIETSDEDLRSVLERVRVPRDFTVQDARTLLTKLA